MDVILQISYLNSSLIQPKNFEVLLVTKYFDVMADMKKDILLLIMSPIAK
jgi:hypothetical protein